MKLLRGVFHGARGHCQRCGERPLLELPALECHREKRGFRLDTHSRRQRAGGGQEGGKEGNPGEDGFHGWRGESGARTTVILFRLRD